MASLGNLLSSPTNLPEDPAVALLDAGTPAVEVAAQYPTSSAAWASLAEAALADGQTITAYAYARTGYHRGLDSLRRAGWKGNGAIPWSHAPNQGFLRALNVLAKAATAIGEADEAHRCFTLLEDSDPAAAAALA